MPAHLKLKFDSVLVAADPLFVQVASCEPDEWAVNAGECGPLPQPQRFAVIHDGLAGMTGIPVRAGRGHEFGEPLGVKLAAPYREDVPLRLGGYYRAPAA